MELFGHAQESTKKFDLSANEKGPRIDEDARAFMLFNSNHDW
jgi:hypothetical protein